MNFLQPHDRNQVTMYSKDSMIAGDNEVRVIDAFDDALDLKRLGKQFKNVFKLFVLFLNESDLIGKNPKKRFFHNLTVKYLHLFPQKVR